MDFLRSCMTNVQLLFPDASYDLTYSIIEASSNSADGKDGPSEEQRAPDGLRQRSDVESSLRELGSLTTVDNEKPTRTWVFNAVGKDITAGGDLDLGGVLPMHTRAEDYSLMMIVTRTGHIEVQAVADALRVGNSNGCEPGVVHFLKALEDHYNHGLSLVATVKPIDFMTWIVQGREESSTGATDIVEASNAKTCNLLVSIALKVVSNGNIVILPAVTQTRFTIIRPASGEREDDGHYSGQSVTLAPIGLCGNVVKAISPTAGTIWSDKAWTWMKDRYPFLRSIEGPRSWIIVTPRVELFRDHANLDRHDLPTTILWPSCLTLAANNSFGTSEEMHEDTLTVSWTDMDYQDPFKLAEDWFNHAQDRTKEVEKAGRDHIISHSEGDQSLDEDTDMLASPLYHRHLDPGSVNGVYPTPPDGILGPHNPAMSSSLNAVDMPPDEDVAMHSSPDTSQQVPTIEIEADEQEEENANLFGEIDEDMFEGPDVTDADFSFFDESAARLSMSRQMSPEKRQELEDHLRELQQSRQAHVQSNLSGDRDMPTLSSLPQSQSMATTDEAAEYTSPIVGAGAEEDDNSGTRINEHLDESLSSITTPPLSPVLVKDKIFGDKGEHESSRAVEDKLQNGISHEFAPVLFKNSVVLTTSKYVKGGKFGNDNGQRTTVPSFSKRSISLRDFLDQRNERNGYSPQAPMKSNHRRIYATDDSDDSDTDATVSSDIRRRPLKKILIEANDDAEMEEDQSALPQKSSDPPLNLDRLEKLLAAWQDINVHRDTPLGIRAQHALQEVAVKPSHSLWNTFDFDGSDIIAVAQLVAEAGIKSLLPGRHEDAEADDGLITSAFVRENCSSLLSSFSGTKSLMLPTLTAFSVSAVAASSEAAKNGPRPTPRRMGSHVGGTPIGQHLLPLIAPFIRLKRSDATWDMLPAAMNFWEALSLGPTNGPKSVLADVISVGSDDVKLICQQFSNDIQYFYEACKLGKHRSGHHIHRSTQPTKMDSTPPSSSADSLLLSTIKQACDDLATKINQRYRTESERPTVIYLFNPCREHHMIKYICACLQSCYRQLTAAARNVSFQIISLPSLARHGGPIVPQPDFLLRIALSIYDKLQPRDRDVQKSVWKGFCAPSVSLVNPLPRKINFALDDRPPINLTQEAQVLHLAYVISSDERWLSCAWSDYTGNYQISRVYCLLRADRSAVFAAIKSLTISLMATSATWRLIVGCVGHIAPTERALWSEVAAPNIAVAMVDVCLSPPVQVFPQPQAEPAESANTAPTTPAIPQTALTPASTPQAASTVSPDAHHPPTPSSTDHNQQAAPAIEAAPDPDAHLIDVRDESYGLILPFNVTHPLHSESYPRPQDRVLASGLLLKRGNAIPNKPLPSLGVDIVEVIPPKGPLGQTSWLAPRTPEYVLREVLAWYRGLAVLGKIRNIKGCEKGEVPWHVGVAVAGADGLLGFFD